MTTVDVGISGPNGSISLSNGLLGAASDVFFAATKAKAAGRAEGTAGAAGCDVSMRGTVVQEILDQLGWASLHANYSSPVAELERFRDSIDPEATYRVSAIEV